MKNEKSYVPLVVFIITVVIVFLVESDKEVLERIGIAIPWGFASSYALSLVIKGADDEFRQSAAVSEKAALLSEIITFPIVFFWLLSIKEGTSWDESWASLVFAWIAGSCLFIAVRYIIKLFEKQH